MTTANLVISNLRSWSWLKLSLFIIAVCTFLTSSFLFLTPPGDNIRLFLAKTVITTQHREWAWIFVGAEQRDLLVKSVQDMTEKNSIEKQNLDAIKYVKNHQSTRTTESLIKVEDISGPLWKGKKMYVYDPTTIRVVVPAKQGEGERISSMVQRTGAVAGVNGGGFIDPDGLGNGFAPIGVIMSGGEILFTDREGSLPQQIVGFTKEGTLIIGKYSIDELLKLNVTEAVSFYPRVIANGKGLIISGDGDWGRAPRTAVGQKADGTLIFIVIDGRQKHSVGATLKEVQDLFLAEDVINAGFLDGGASSELVVEGELVTKPSSRYGERRLPSAFLVFAHPEDVKVDNVWRGVDKIDPGGRYDHPDFLKEQEEKKSQPKASTVPTATPKASMKPGTGTGTNTGTGNSTAKPSASSAPARSPVPSPGVPESSIKPGATSLPAGSETNSPAASGSPSPAASAAPSLEAGSGTTGANTGTGGAASSPAPSAAVKPAASPESQSAPSTPVAKPE